MYFGTCTVKSVSRVLPSTEVDPRGGAGSASGARGGSGATPGSRRERRHEGTRPTSGAWVSCRCRRPSTVIGHMGQCLRSGVNLSTGQSSTTANTHG